MATKEIVQGIQQVMAEGGDGGPFLRKVKQLTPDVEVWRCDTTRVQVSIRDPQPFTHPKVPQVVVAIPLSLSKSMSPYVMNDLYLVGHYANCYLTVVTEPA